MTANPSSLPSLLDLRERFVQHPLLPDDALRQQNKWRARWGMAQKDHEPGERWQFFFDPSEIQGGTANDPRRRLRFAFETGKPGTKYFLTGSKGAGKSTTANAIWADPKTQDRYTLLGFTVHDYLNLADADASQVILVMIAHLVERLRDVEPGAKLGVLKDRATIASLEDLLKKVRPSASVDRVNVNVFGLFTASFKESSSARSEFKKFIDGRFDEVVVLLDELDTLLEKHTGKPTLFIIDDLDKIAISDIRRQVFQLQLPMLLRPRCAALYSYPLEVDHDPQFDGLKRGHPHRYVLANVKLVDEERGPMLVEGRKVMTELVLRRLDGHQLNAVINLSSQQWDGVLHYSAGNFRELSRIVGHAFEIAAMDTKTKADKNCFELALQRLRADYNPFVQRYRSVLADIDQHRGQPPDGVDPELLSTLLAAFVVVEYPNEPGWLGLNPIVKDLLTDTRSRISE